MDIGVDDGGGVGAQGEGGPGIGPDGGTEADPEARGERPAVGVPLGGTEP
ncbi:hypothetical protein AB0M47_37260 [Hamadaea sp. NPDC051192]